MKRLLTTALFTGMTLASVGPVLAMDKTLSGLDVKVDLSAYADNNVLKYWPTLEADLATAIASKVTLDDAADAPRIAVEINKVAIDGGGTDEPSGVLDASGLHGQTGGQTWQNMVDAELE